MDWKQQQKLSTIIGQAAMEVGITALKPEQEQAILAFVNGTDVFGCLSTGYRKSLCYGLLPKVYDALRGVVKKSVVIVVCPLISLMKDQVTRFEAKGVTAMSLSDKESLDCTSIEKVTTSCCS